jgi:NAD(P)-dependent dehydrogenase (short-subunit alcohol dehydrogenase family)
MSLEGKIAIVTGAGRGLGRAIAEVLAERGVSVVLTGRTPETLESIRDEIQSTGGRVEIVPGDVGVRADVDHAVQTTVDAFGGLDILVNNAQSLDTNESVLDVTDESLALPFRSGLFGTLYMMQACYPHLKARGGGSIVNFGSSTSIHGTAGFASYVMTKEAIRGLTRIAAREWGGDGIRVNVVCPAGLTGATKQFFEDYPDRFAAGLERIPLRRMGDPVDDIGRAVAALVDDDLAYLTGATLMLDGGANILH